MGAGATAPCISAMDGTTKPPTWKAFLGQLKRLMPTGSPTTLVDDLIQKDKYLDAAEVIVNALPVADFSQAIRNTFVQPKFGHSPMHEAILKIDPKVVVTTNYDDIYDSYCRSGLAVNGYNVCRYYDAHLVADLRSPVRLVVKAHGCVADPTQIVLTRSQYFKERQKHPGFYRVLDALFLTNTILFVGYSLSDPDIQLVLENVNIAAQSAHPHYALIADDIHIDIERAAAKAYNIHFLRFPSGDYTEAQRALKQLSDDVTQFRTTNPT